MAFLIIALIVVVLIAAFWFKDKPCEREQMGYKCKGEACECSNN